MVPVLETSSNRVDRTLFIIATQWVAVNGLHLHPVTASYLVWEYNVRYYLRQTNIYETEKIKEPTIQI